ncbi:hypothetical protein [Nocardiopsis alba]|uniref:hypothetical protein n=1 Tax=Nocardiopsis alba TaxID=53437 RepID=UPI003D744DB9
MSTRSTTAQTITAIRTNDNSTIPTPEDVWMSAYATCPPEADAISSSAEEAMTIWFTPAVTRARPPEARAPMLLARGFGSPALNPTPTSRDTSETRSSGFASTRRSSRSPLPSWEARLPSSEGVPPKASDIPLYVIRRSPAIPLQEREKKGKRKQRTAKASPLGLINLFGHDVDKSLFPLTVRTDAIANAPDGGCSGTPPFRRPGAPW